MENLALWVDEEALVFWGRDIKKFRISRSLRDDMVRCLDMITENETEDLVVIMGNIDGGLIG